VCEREGAKTIAPTSTMLTPHKIFKLTAAVSARGVRQLDWSEGREGMNLGDALKGVTVRAPPGLRTQTGLSSEDRATFTLKRLNVASMCCLLPHVLSRRFGSPHICRPL